MFQFSMAENLDDGELWLSPHIHSDNDGDDSTTTLFSLKMNLQKLEHCERKNKKERDCIWVSVDGGIQGQMKKMKNDGGIGIDEEKGEIETLQIFFLF